MRTLGPVVRRRVPHAHMPYAPQNDVDGAEDFSAKLGDEGVRRRACKCKHPHHEGEHDSLVDVCRKQDGYAEDEKEPAFA